MFGSSMLEIIIEMAIVIISLIILFLIGRVLILKVKKSLEFNSRQRKNLTREKETNPSGQTQNTTPSPLKILMNPHNKYLFENFISLIDKIDWPEYPNGSLNLKGENFSPTESQLKNYDEKLKRALEEEDKMYELYTNHLSSNNVFISKTELSHAVKQFKKKTFIVET